MEELSDYYFSQSGLVLVPIEHLSSEGMSPRFEETLRDRTGFPADWAGVFNESFRRFWRRATNLSERAPDYWLPPRLQHVSVVTDPARVRPFHQPLSGCSWLVYQSDFDPEISHPEFGAYQLLQAEWMGITRQIVGSLVHNLSYWLLRSEPEVESFREASCRAPRPDAALFQTLAGALGWIPRLYHNPLRRPVLISPEPLAPVENTGLLVTPSLREALDELVREWTRIADRAKTQFLSQHAVRKKDRSRGIGDWLASEKPPLLVTGRENRLLWDVASPHETAVLRSQLRNLGDAAAASLLADLEVVGARSRLFLDSLTGRESLPPPHPNTEQRGLSYLHLGKRLVAYNIAEPGTERLREPAPPFERLLLGARTLHEWAHLAVDAGWVPVPDDRKERHREIQDELCDLFDEVRGQLPATVRIQTDEQLRMIEEEHRQKQGAGGPSGQPARPSRALVRVPLERMPDFQANLLASRYLPPDEMETYVRTNVRALLFDTQTTGLLTRLSRHAYEYQYLRFSRMEERLGYFLDSTWFKELYLKPRFLDEDQLDRLLILMGELCDAYTIDESKFRFP